MGDFMLMNDEWRIALNKEGETYMLFDPQRTTPTRNTILRAQASTG